MTETAYLYNEREKEYICFDYKNRTIRFLGPYSLERFLRIVSYEQGLITVIGLYNGEEVEDYIDLNYVLDQLYIDPEEFLHGLSEVKIKCQKNN